VKLAFANRCPTDRRRGATDVRDDTAPKVARMRDQQLREVTPPGLHETLLERVVRLPGINPETAILDLGCGSGAWLARLARSGFKALRGIDNQSVFSLPREGQFPASFCDGDLDNDCDLGLGQARFGLITAIEVIEHLHNPGRLLRLVTQYLSDDGCFLLTTPNVHSIRARLRFAVTGKLAGFDPTNVPAEPSHLYPVFLTCLDRLLVQYSLKADLLWTFPAHGGRGTRWLPKLAASLGSLMFENVYPGDSLCVLARRAQRRL